MYIFARREKRVSEREGEEKRFKKKIRRRKRNICYSLVGKIRITIIRSTISDVALSVCLTMFPYLRSEDMLCFIYNLSY